MFKVFFSDLNAPNSAPNCSNSSVHRDDVGVATRGGSGVSAKAAARVENRRTEKQGSFPRPNEFKDGMIEGSDAAAAVADTHTASSSDA